MSRVLYILVLIGAGLFYLLYSDSLSFVLLTALIILPVMLLAQLIISAAFLKCSVKGSRITAFKGEPCEAAFTITNNSVFPLPNTTLKIKAVCAPTGAVSYSSVSVPIPALRTETVTVTIGSEHCSRTDITVESVKIFDLLRLFSVKRFRKKMHCSVYIIPKLRESFAEEARELLRLPAPEMPSETSTAPSFGGYPGDVCGYREFMQGDRLSLMHYKLSARFDKDIVKVLGTNSDRRFFLTADLSETDLSRRDAALERLMSVAYYLSAENAEVFMAVPDKPDSFEVLEIMRSEVTAAARLRDGADYFAVGRLLCGEYFPDAQSPAELIRVILRAN